MPTRASGRRRSHAYRMPTTSIASAVSRQTTNSALPMALPHFATTLPFAVACWNSSKNVYSPAFSGFTVTTALPPGGITRSCFRSLLSNSIAFLLALVTSMRNRWPAGTSSTTGSNLPSRATSLKSGESCAHAVAATSARTRTTARRRAFMRGLKTSERKARAPTIAARGRDVNRNDLRLRWPGRPRRRRSVGEEEGLDQARNGLGLIVMQHVAGTLDDRERCAANLSEARAHAGEAVGVRLTFGMTVEPAGNLRLRGGHPEDRRAN